MSEVAIRLARPGEFPAIDRLIDDAYAHDYGRDEDHDSPMSASAFRAVDFDVWAAADPDPGSDDTGTLIGSVTTRRRGGPPLHEDFRPDELDLRLLGVSPLARRRGVGAAIMRAVIAHAESIGFAAVALKTAPNMHGAHRLYESLGFVRAPERDGLWIGGERVLDLYTYRYPLRADS